MTEEEQGGLIVLGVVLAVFGVLLILVEIGFFQ